MLQYNCTPEQEQAIQSHIKNLWENMTKAEKEELNVASFPKYISKAFRSDYCKFETVAPCKDVDITLAYSFGTADIRTNKGIERRPCVLYWAFWAKKSAI